MSTLAPHGARSFTAARKRLATLALHGLALATISLLAPATHAAEPSAAPSFIAFESGQVRPLAMSADGTRLFAVNTPDNTLEVFLITPNGLQLQARVPVGLEPVAVAQRNDNEVWVVNHLSDSVSVVSLSGTPHVTRTLLVGDEPRDIVFAGSPAKAFITTAHRGQHRVDPSINGTVPGTGDPQLFTASVPRADVWVFNPGNLGNTVGGTPLRIMSFFADTPRALAVSPDKNTVYVAAFKSGNQTSNIDEDLVCNGFEKARPCRVKGKTYPGGAPGPSVNVEGKPAPEVGIMVKYDKDKKQWLDVLGRDWTSAMRFELPDKDVFAIDANGLSSKAIYTGVGTVLFNMAVNPASGKLYVSNTEANNMGRFEGSGKLGPTLQGKIALSRVTVIDGDKVQPRHLNKHLDYSKLASAPDFDKTAKQHSLSTPMDMAVSKDGSTLYVTAFGSSRIGVYDTAELESDSFNPSAASARHITVSGGGPSGLVLDEARGRMYVMTRFDNAIKVIKLTSREELSKVDLPNPEPAHIIKGRPFLYDAQRSSANGEASCASCHIFGDMDDLAWDLGNPDDKVITNPLEGGFDSPFMLASAKLLFNVKSKINGSDKNSELHPLKGPMTTQTLRGMRHSGAMHWRGDRSVGTFGVSATDSNLSFKNFAVAFEGLLGNDKPLSEAEMQTFADFQLSVLPPPNPVRALDNQLNEAQKRGAAFFNGPRPSDGVRLPLFGIDAAFNCNGCHALDPAKGQFGTGGKKSFEALPQILKIPQLRNLYAKVGRFGQPATDFYGMGDLGHMGEQVRGFGFGHDGALDTILRFFTAKVFRDMGNTGFPSGAKGQQLRQDAAEYVMAFDADLAPIVGQQITLSSTNLEVVKPRIELLKARAKAPFVSKELGGSVTECDLVARAVENGKLAGFLYSITSGGFIDAKGVLRSDDSVMSLATTPGQEVTFTCAPPGSGKRMAFGA